MNLAVASQELSETFEALPQPDWAGLLVADDVHGLQKKVDQFEVDTSKWRATMAMRMRAALNTLTLEIDQLPKNGAHDAVQSAVGPAISGLEEAIHAHDQPLHTDPRVGPLLATIAREAPSTAKVIRKLLRRIERLRVDRRNACVDMYYALLAFESERDPDFNTRQTFTSGSDLADYLRKKIA